MKEMSLEDEQRIEEYANDFAKNHSCDVMYDCGVRAGYIIGAMNENERMAELLKNIRNKAIDECIEALSSYRDIDRTQMKEVLESLKSQ